MPDSALPDVALVSLGTTPGLRRADDALAELLAEAGATCRVVRVRIGASGRLRRHPALTDLVEALAARRAARGVEARATVYSTVTAALLQPPRPNAAVRFDAPAALNRAGVGGAWQRRLERAALGRAALLLPWGEAAAAAAREVVGEPVEVDRLAAELVRQGRISRAQAVAHPLRSGLGGDDASGAAATVPVGPEIVPLPVPIDDVPGGAERDLDAVAYAGYPRKRGLELLCAAWAEAARPGARLAIGGLDRDKALAWLRRTGVEEPAGVEWLGALPRADWLATVGRARLFVNASRWEDHGLAQLEALAAGCALATVPSPGAYEALPLARALAPALVAADCSPGALARALRAGLAMSGDERAAYAERALALLAPYRRDAVLATLRERVLPALGGEAA